jgi:hypothetical protein
MTTGSMMAWLGVAVEVHVGVGILLRVGVVIEVYVGIGLEPPRIRRSSLAS